MAEKVLISCDRSQHKLFTRLSSGDFHSKQFLMIKHEMCVFVQYYFGEQS